MDNFNYEQNEIIPLQDILEKHIDKVVQGSDF